MKNILLSSLLIVVVSLLLSACVSINTKLGINEAEWLSYSQVDQKKILASYKVFVIEHDQAINKKIDTSSNSVFLDISIHDGQVMMSPFVTWYDYEPVNFRIFKEQCRDIVLRQKNNLKNQIELGVCFRGNTLYFDPSHYDLSGHDNSIRINYSPLWLSGFSYKEINTNGYVKLKNVTIEVKQE